MHSGGRFEAGGSTVYLGRRAPLTGTDLPGYGNAVGLIPSAVDSGSTTDIPRSTPHPSQLCIQCELVLMGRQCARARMLLADVAPRCWIAGGVSIGAPSVLLIVVGTRRSLGSHRVLLFHSPVWDPGDW
jgi:hypothetical protein